MKNRLLTRMNGFDYRTEACYFVTSCCKDRIHHFGHVENGKLVLNAYSQIAAKQIEWFAEQYPYLRIHNSVVMPNHVHILLEIDCSKIPHVEQPVKIKSVSSLMGAYKTTTSKQIRLAGNVNFEWQRSFHDRIVRDQIEFNPIHRYISNNPEKWIENRLNDHYVRDTKLHTDEDDLKTYYML
jgi:putative transposase